MEHIVTAKSFFEDFNQIVHDNKANKCYLDDKKFTSRVTQYICEILDGYKLETQQEYFRIDIIGYESHYQDIQNKRKDPITPYAWDLKVAVEHENNDKLWMDEIVKLAHVFCDLRVVIGYLPENKRAKGEDEKCLAYVVDILKKHCECFRTMKDRSREFLVIIGNSNTKGNPELFFHYKGYVFNPENEMFELISDETV